jgi:hypothetical protein
VDLVEVDPIGLEPAERILDLANDPAARVAELIGIVPHRPVHLGREHDVVAPAAGECLADDLLRLPACVDVGRVDEVDARIERPVDDADALVVVRISPAAEHHRAEAERADLDPGACELSIVHAREPSDPGVTARARGRTITIRTEVWPVSCGVGASLII